MTERGAEFHVPRRDGCPMTSPISVGILGTGWAAGRTSTRCGACPAWRSWRSPGATPPARRVRREARAARLCRRRRAARGPGDRRDAHVHHQPVHYEQPRRARAGKHVLCEKPLGVRRRERALALAAAARGGARGRVGGLLQLPPLPDGRADAARVRPGRTTAHRTSSTAPTCRTGCCTRRTGAGGSRSARAAARARWPTSARTGQTSSST